MLILEIQTLKNKMELLLKQIENIIDKDLPLVSNLSNVSAILNQMKDINWAGFYIVEGNYLYLGPFQGDVACTKIEKGKGVCGTSFERKETIVVDNVNEFKGHIPCSSLTKSEIVVPIIKDGSVKAVIDIGAPTYARFHEEEKELLEKVSVLLAELF